MIVAYLAIGVACVVFAVGSLIFLSNPQRAVNRAVFAGTIQMVAWLVLWHLTTSSREGLYWLRWTCAVGALAPLNFWIVREAIIQSESASAFERFARAFPWGVASAAFFLIPFSHIFIPASSTPGKPEYGWGYYFYLWGLFTLYIILFRESFSRSKSVYGAERMELQVWIGGGSFLATIIYSLMLLSTVTGDPFYRRLQPLATLIFYAGTAYIITSYKIFDARELVISGARKIFFIFVVASLGFATDHFVDTGRGVGFKWIIFACFTMWLFSVKEKKLGLFTRTHANRGKTKRLIEEVAKRESHSQQLEAGFIEIIKNWSGAGLVNIFHFPHASFPKILGTSDLSYSRIRDIVTMGWATPERLEREKNSEVGNAIAVILRENGWRALVAYEGESFITIVGIGSRSSLRPYTYPQVLELMELGAML